MKYHLSKDYNALFDLLLAGHDAVGFVDYEGGTGKVWRDVCAIRRVDEYRIIGWCRGITYLSVDPWLKEESALSEREIFCGMCENSNVEWITPGPDASIPVSLVDASKHQATTSLMDTFNRALEDNPYLTFEIGYTRATGWMVHIWDNSGGANKKIICAQHDVLGEACREARDELARLCGEKCDNNDVFTIVDRIPGVIDIIKPWPVIINGINFQDKMRENATLRAELAVLKAKTTASDSLIRRLQDAVYHTLRDGMSKISRDPEEIDGSGSDGDEVDLTRTEAEQFVECAVENYEELTALKAAARPVAEWWDGLKRNSKWNGQKVTPEMIAIPSYWDGQPPVSVAQIDELARLCGDLK